MTIKNMDNYIEQLWDWGFLDTCFGTTKIRVTDIDGFVERRGRFLVIECKSHNAPIPKGQEIMFNEMVKTGYFSVIVVWGNANCPEKIHVLGKKGIKIYDNATEDDFKKIVSRWFVYANGSVK